jgi:phosphatidylinositol glycan class H protein
MPVHLILRRPSPTTVSFTVSNASKHTSTPARVLFYLQILLRALLFLCIVFCDIAKVRHSFFDEDGSLVQWTAVWSSSLGSFVCRIVDAYSSAVVASLSVLLLYCVFRKGYTGIFSPLEWTADDQRLTPFS